MKMTRWFFAAGIAGACAAAGAGTVTAEKVVADEVLTQQIGLPPRSEPETSKLYYGFTDNQGSAVPDLSGNGYGGVASGCAWTNAGPYSGGSMFFDGVNDYISVGSEPNFPTWSAYSVSAWFLHNGGGDVGGGYGHKIVDKTVMYHDWHLNVIPPNGILRWVFYEGGQGGGLVDDSRDFRDGAWHHVVAVKSGTAGQLWVDGALESTSSVFPVYSGGKLCVGNSFSTDSYQRMAWSGMIDEVRVYDRALSSNEVVRLYADGLLSVTNAAGPEAVAVTTNLTVAGGLTVTGDVSFVSGVFYSRPLGDLSCGIYTNTP